MEAEQTPLWAKIIDQSRCIGCHACTTACKSENEVPLSVTRTYVKSVDVGTFPQARRAFQVTRCNQCESAPCVTACPTSAMYRRPDGIVDFDKSVCIGCKACMAACPYDAIFINPEDHSAEKCNFCAHRLDVGLEPACVVVCPVEALLVGDMRDPTSKVGRMIGREALAVRRPEKATRPKVFYKGAHQATLDPLAARRPDGGLYAWNEQPKGRNEIGSGQPARWNSSAAALLSYDVSHTAPWDWRVSLYTWTKSIAAGSCLVALLLAALGGGSWSGALWTVVAPLVSLIFLGFTGVVLIVDLEHPERFYLIFARPQWRSWLVRGAFIISAYGAVLTIHLIASLSGRGAITPWLAFAGVPLAVGTAAYTGYLFAQAKARDLWQNPLLPPHLVVQALIAGAAALLPFVPVFEARAWQGTLIVLGIATLSHLMFVAAEVSLAHMTAHAQAAMRTMTHGRYAGMFWASLVCAALAAIACISPVPRLAFVAVPLALAALFLYEHAYVQAGQSVPLA
ncbi:MAG: polysulfide reductase NrfD [Candidatus Eremiobacteraeota bacterium]|nr:polysulfide reductase NrfD [Candidatus Eremiobacteraeota bacterium]